MKLIIQLTLPHFASMQMTSQPDESAVVLVSALNNDVIKLTQWFSVDLFTSQ